MKRTTTTALFSLAVLTAATLLPAQDTDVGPQQGPQNLMDQAVNNNTQLTVDDSFKGQEKIRDAERYEHQGQTDLAIKTYQQIIDDFGQKLISAAPDSFVSYTDYIRAKLLAMPAVQKGQYDQLFGPQAAAAIDAAVQAHDPAAVLKACDRYFPSAATVTGLSRAAEWFFENGNFSSAARAWELLLTHPGAAALKPILLYRAALAEKLAGRTLMATALRDQLAHDFPNATGDLAGQSTPLLQNLDTLFAQPAWAATTLPPDEWPMFQGSPNRSLLADVRSSAGANLWRVSLDDDTGPTDPNAATSAINGQIININGRFRRINMGDDNGDQPVIPAVCSYPVISGGQLFIHAGQSIICLSAAGSNQLWTYPAQPGAAPPNQPNMQALRAAAHDSCAIVDDHVFAILPAGPRGNANPNPEFNGGGFVPNMGLATNRLVALTRDGKELWSKPTSDIVADLKDSFPKLAQGMVTLLGSPLATHSGIYVMARKIGGDSFSQLYLLKFDPDTGKTLWGTYLCSANQNNYYGYGLSMASLAIPTLSDDTLFISTGQGADCAVDANLGRILWLNITEGAKNKNPEMQPNFTDIRSWNFNPPLVYEGLVVTLETNSPIRIYDRVTGKLLHSLAPSNYGNPKIIAGIDHGNLITLGDSLCSINLDTLKPAFDPVDYVGSEGKLAGRPFLTEKVLYLPLENGLKTIAVDTGEIMNFSDWPMIPTENGGDRPGHPGNLLVTSEQIIVASENDVAGYSKWETALANRLKAIAADPQAPRPYLDLAEISFRTAHFDLAEQNMKQAVDHVNADLASASPPDDTAKTAARIYRTNISFGEQLLAKENTALRDRARFYYDCARQTARDPDANAEWRLCLAVLATDQKKYDEAVQLSSAVLTDPALRNAPFHRGDNMTRAGATAEVNIRKLLKDVGRDPLYQPYEAQAESLLAKGRANNDPALIDNVIFGYPNSHAALTAAAELARTYHDRQQYLDQLRILTWLYPRDTEAANRAQITAAFASANASLGRFPAALAWAERGVRQFHDTPFSTTAQSSNVPATFPALATAIRAALPATAVVRRPILTPFKSLAFKADSAAYPNQIAFGNLLSPIEQNPAFRKADALFVYNDSKVSMYSADSFHANQTPAWTTPLKEQKQAALLGVANNTAIVVTPAYIHGIDVATGNLKYALTWDLPDEDSQRLQQQQQRLRAIAMQQRVLVQGPNGQAVFIQQQNAAQGDSDGDPNALLQMGLDPESLRIAQLQASLFNGKMNFNSLTIVGSRLVAVVGQEVRAFDLATGKPCWDKNPVLPAGITGVVVGNDELMVAEIDSPDRAATTLIVIDAATGAWHAKIQLNDERVMWRALSDDGILYTISDQAIAAWDLHADTTAPAWRKPSYAQLRYAFAAQLTLDGLLFIDNTSDLICIPPDGDESRGWSQRLDITINSGQFAGLRTFPDGQDLLIQTADALVCYRTSDDLSNTSEPGSRLVWQAVLGNPGECPPLVGLNQGERHLALLAAGPIRNTQHAVHLIVIDEVDETRNTRSNGAVVFNEKLHQPGEPSTSEEGPPVRAWQLVDHGIALELAGSVYVFQTKTP